jgi:eukaryotic-like serine/threonine-protein kinase
VDARFGPFRILARLGRGGMAETFLAERAGPLGFVQRVCVKRILRDRADDPRLVRSFQDEARLAALLVHPNIVSVLDFGEEHGSWWMALELVDGLDLRALLVALRARGEALPEELALFIVAEVTKALAYAHERRLPDGSPAGIVHRDVSPSNVLISYDGAVALADFGIARAAQNERTETGVVKGKVPYMPPEQALARPLDARADLFALGVMTFELLAGQRPFDGPSDLETLQNIVEGRRPSLAELAPATPRAVVQLVDALLEPSRDRRPASAAVVLDALSSLAAPPPNVVRSLGALAASVQPPQDIPPDGLLTEIDVVGLAEDETSGSSARRTSSSVRTAPDTVMSPPPAVRSSRAPVLGLLAATSLGMVALVAVLGSGVPLVDAPLAPTAQVAPRDQDAGGADLPSLPDAGIVEVIAAPVVAATADPPPRRVARRAEQPPPRPVLPAVVTIVVPPVGEVRIDGVLVGQSPVTREIAPGRHTFEGTRGLDRAEETIDLASGEQRQIVLRPRAR